MTSELVKQAKWCCMCGKDLPAETPYAYAGTYLVGDEFQYLCVDAGYVDCFMGTTYKEDSAYSDFDSNSLDNTDEDGNPLQRRTE